MENNSPTLGQLLSIKSVVWVYVSELRLCTKESMVNYDPKVISRVVIGVKMSQRDTEIQLSLLRGHPVLDKVLV
ncbi:hypothetical protein, partial [Vibrio sp. S457-15]|uniref:hypothetical protein n=1 Tax=Vibrio sp. S457-15 TaxID=1620393 RepID=UPI001E310EDE